MNSFFYTNKKFRSLEKKKLIKTFDSLWPLNRSLTGNDVRKTHKIIRKILPLRTFEINSLTKVHDWQVPLEWNVNKAYIKDSKGKTILDFKNNNLHLASYSISFNGELTFQELKKKLFFIKNKPNAIPYKTLYYNNDWAFCISYKNFKKLKNQRYYVFIDTSLKKGSMTISDYLIPGKTKKEILVHTYTCHPSLANNELSGPITTTFLAKRIKNNYFSYRFIFAPETIGAIAYLNKFGKHLKKNLIAGYICTCTGIDKFITYKKSKKEDSLADIFAIETLKEYNKFKIKIKNFSPSGSDERQYCSLGYNLPVGSIMSKPYGEYPEYHTSLDNKKTINFSHLQKIIDFYFDVFCKFETKKNQIFKMKEKKFQKKIKKKCIYPINLKKMGEPMISKYKLHYGVKNYYKADKFTMGIKWLIHYSSGQYSINEISKMSKIKKKILIEVLNKLVKKKIFKKVIT